MNCESSMQTALVTLPVSLIETLLKIRSALDDDVALVLSKSVGSAPASNNVPPVKQPPDVAAHERGKYTAEFLGVVFAANTLATVFSQVVDMMADVAPEELVKLAAIRTRGRRFVSRKPLDIHPHSPHLPVMQTTSGWWISKNISQPQLKQALRTLCKESSLSFAKDIKFPLRQPR